jgi:hypothetical protein
MSDEFQQKVQQTCIRALEWAKKQDYTGYDKHDGLNSPLLKTLSFNNKWLRMLFIQGVMRFPVNIRPLLGVKKVRNPKGIALFARAYLNLYRVTGDKAFRHEAESLLSWLLENSSQGFSGMSWGYHYSWQDVGFFAPANFPNRIVTYFVGRALVDAYEVLDDRNYLDAAEQAVEFILNEPKNLYEDEGMKCLSYVPVPDISMAVMDVSALCGALCAMVGKHTGKQELLDEARKLIAWVVDKQTQYGAWFYTHPPGDSRITHDNYHTGEILDAILDYMNYAGEQHFENAYHSGLEYYRENLFTSEWRPRWMNDREFPYDIHGYSQGIITFSAAGRLDLAEKVARAALDDMWDEESNRFYYQKRKFYTKKFTLLRWCQGWMTLALSNFLTSDRIASIPQVNQFKRTCGQADSAS